MRKTSGFQLRSCLYQTHSRLLASLFVLLAFSCASQTNAQSISWATPERDTTTPIGGESGAVGLGAANFNDALYVAYTGTASVDSKGDSYIYTAYNTDGGVNYGNKHQITVSGGQTVAGDTNPALAAYNGKLYVAYVDGYGGAYFASSLDGSDWGSRVYSCGGSFSIDASPTLAVFDGYLWMGLRDHNTLAMVICRIASDNTVTTTEYSSITLNFNPSLAVFDSKLYAAIESNNTSHTLYVYTSTDGATFSLLSPGPSSDQTSRAPTLAVHNNILYLGFRENDSSDKLLYRYSTDGVNFATAISAGTQVGGDPLFLQVSNLPGSSYNGELFLYFASFSPTYLCSNHGN